MQAIYAPVWDGYELLDAGHGNKLERWGTTITIRPDSLAYFKPKHAMDYWLQQADFIFKTTHGVFGVWKPLTDKPLLWNVSYEELRFILSLKDTKHTGLFPEQAVNWKTLQQNLRPGLTFLNLFAYTGASSIVAMQCGAEVIHVDSSKSVLSWAKENQLINSEGKMKLVHEDALLFLQRELKRGHRYDVIQMDPPAWGNSINGKKWKLEECLEGLLKTASGVLTERGMLILNTYSNSLSYAAIIALLKSIFPLKKIQAGSLNTKASTGKVLEHGLLFRVY
ncbi:MAG: class I SAM-dependent methyltransferase [Flavobacteriales bacterium]